MLSRYRPGLRNAFALACLAGVGGPQRAPAQVSPEASAAVIRPDEGLEATLWASEPMVVNPTAIDSDSRGRTWVTEGINYRHALHKGQPYDDEGDRVKILEDTDGDGRADKVTVFADRIYPVPMGLAVEERYDRRGRYAGCKVYVGNSPDLLVLEDTDGDDRADRRYPLLSGFGGVDHDHGVHGMAFGPDGKLYFTQGDGGSKERDGYQFVVEDRSGRVVANDQLAATMRVNRDGTQFEILADRQRNNYETALDTFGHAFTSDNDDDGNRGSRVIWVLDGGSYGYRTPGSPRHWGEEVPGNVPKLVGTGNGSPSGLMVYEGTLLPGKYFGSVLEVDAGTRRVNHFPLSRHGAAFRTVGGRALLGSDDPWFRPIDACAAPDGSVFVADWYDAAVGGHAMRDQTTGRIYRIAPKGVEAEAPEYDFGSIAGLIEALKSPNIAARDAAFRGLVSRGAEANRALSRLYATADPVLRARILWVFQGSDGGIPDDLLEKFVFNDPDPRIRELGIRMLGRDLHEVGEVEYGNPEAKQSPPALAHLDVLLPLAGDPDAGVRRELILALRNVPTERAGEALRTLVASWDGRDRWYLEALGLALRDREPEFLSSLFDGSLYGPMDLDALGHTPNVALPPYFPVDRNEAFLSAGDELPPANALTKTLGLMWMVHRAEVLPLLATILPRLGTPDLQQAADDVLMLIDDPAGAVALVSLVRATPDPIRRRQVLATLGRKLERDWREAAGRPEVVAAIEAALGDPATRAQAIATAAATGDRRHAGAVIAAIEDEQAPEEVRAAAVEALGRLGPPGASETLDRLIAAAIERLSADPLAQAAVRALPGLGDAAERLGGLVRSADTPLGLRREALTALAATGTGAQRLLDLARRGELPEELRTIATLTLHASPDRRIRGEAERVLPLPRTAAGRPLPPFSELIRRDGDPDRGRAAFFRVPAGDQAALGCGSCHRVQGRGEWIGPDLSTIGIKYGKEELLRSILGPSEAIGYNYRSLSVATADGRILTGLPVEDSPARLVIKTSDGRRIALDPGQVDERRWSDVSLMPEGLAETMGEQDLVDLLAFLTTLRKPVSVLGLAQVFGPVAEEGDRPTLDQSRPIASNAGPEGRDGQPLPWRRIAADGEGRIDLTPFRAEGDGPRALYLYTPVTSPAEQSARLVLDTEVDVRAWLGGRELELGRPADGEPRSASLTIPRGSTGLILRLPTGSTLTATVVCDVPVEFSTADAIGASAR